MEKRGPWFQLPLHDPNAIQTALNGIQFDGSIPSGQMANYIMDWVSHVVQFVGHAAFTPTSSDAHGNHVFAEKFRIVSTFENYEALYYEKIMVDSAPSLVMCETKEYSVDNVTYNVTDTNIPTVLPHVLESEVLQQSWTQFDQRNAPQSRARLYIQGVSSSFPASCVFPP